MSNLKTENFEMTEITVVNSNSNEEISSSNLIEKTRQIDRPILKSTIISIEEVTNLPTDDSNGELKTIISSEAIAGKELEMIFIVNDTGKKDQRTSQDSARCRICLEDDEQSLIRPCNCKGTVGYVHVACLETWLLKDQRVNCEICDHKFDVSLKYNQSTMSSIMVFLCTDIHSYKFHQIIAGITLFITATIFVLMATSFGTRIINYEKSRGRIITLSKFTVLKAQIFLGFLSACFLVLALKRAINIIREFYQWRLTLATYRYNLLS